MLYSLSYGGTTLSLATGESATFTTATAKASRRIALGIEQFAATAATGAVSTTNCPVYMQFVSPVVVNPGEYIQIVAKNVGVVTTVGTITAMVTFDGYAE
jgi:hypothetical protein